MTTELPTFSKAWGDYSNFTATIHATHQVAAPHCGSGFSEHPMRYSHPDGTYDYFPHPQDAGAVLGLAHDLAKNADDIQRALIVPIAIRGLHAFKDGNGRTHRAAHAILMGRSQEAIDKLGIHGARDWIGTDEAAQNVIDLRPPAELIPIISDRVYEMTETNKTIGLQTYGSTFEGLGNYRDLLDDLSPHHAQSLADAITASSRWFMLYDTPSTEFALNAMEPEIQYVDGEIDTPGTLASLGTSGLEKFVDKLWQYRTMRAQAEVASVGDPDFGSRIVNLPGQSEPMSIADHYIHLTNNLIPKSY